MAYEIQTSEEETLSAAYLRYSAETQLHHELAALNTISWALSQSLDLDRVLELALEASLRVLDSRAGCIHMPAEAESNQLQLRVHLGLPVDLIELVRVISMADPKLQRLLASHEVGALDQCLGVLELPGDTPGPRPGITGSWVCFPLWARDRFQGLMSLVIDEFTPERAGLLKAIGRHVAMAIDNAQLYHRVQQDAQRLRREAQRWHALNQAALSVGSAHNEQGVYNAITQTLSSLGLSAIILAIDSNAPDATIVSVAAPSPRLWRDIERLAGLPVLGYRIPLKQWDVYLRLAEQDQPRLFMLSREHLASLLPEPFAHLLPRIVRRAGLDHAIAVPLKVNTQAIALLFVAGSDLRTEDVPAIIAFADQASAALENARLIQAERHQRQVAEMLHDLVVMVNSTLEVDQVLNIAVHRLQALYQATACSVSFLEEDGETFVFRATTDPGLDVSQRITFPASQSVAGRAIRERQVQVVDDVYQSPDYRAEMARRTGLADRSLLTAPLFADDKPLGVIQVISALPNAFTQSDAALLATTAALIETAIARAQAYARAVQLIIAEQNQRQVAEALHRAALALTSTMALDQVFERILSELQHVVPYDSASVQLLKGDQLEIIGGRGFPNLSELLGVSFPAQGDNPNALVLESRAPVIISDVQPRYSDFSQEPHAAANIRGWLGVPLLIGDRVIGMLALDKQRPAFYNETHAQIAMAYAAQAAIAIENARLHEALQDYTAELEERVEARTAEVNRGHERLLAVLESAGEAIAIANAEGIIEYANPAWEELTGYSVSQAVQQRTRILDAETFPDLLVAVRNTVQSQRVWHRELIQQRPDGASYVVDLTVTPVFDEARTLTNLVAIYRDVTQYKELDRIKSEFLSTAAHELRSPLTSILGFSELLLLRDDLSDDEQTRFLRYIYDHAMHLKQLVSDLLDISRIESGASFTVNLEPLDLWPLFEQEISSWQEAYPRHSYKLHAGRDWPPVRADKERIGQVMRNLLSNATKYSPGGGTITVSAIPVGGYIEISVADEGIGMSREELAHIFEKFWRADASSTAIEGTGLGLVIVRHIVEQHGGQIWVESTKGQGTTVHFTLPLVDRQTTVLIVEDEDSVREIEHRILSSNGIATLLAKDGYQAIEMAQSQRPDLILLDLMMPGMSGQEVLHILKSKPATRHIPVVIISARASWPTIEESYVLGAVDFVTKPFEYQELLSRVRRALKIAAGSRQQAKDS